MSDDKYLILMKAAERCPGHWEFEKGETYWVQRDVALRMEAKNSAVIVSRPKAKRVEPEPVAPKAEAPKADAVTAEPEVKETSEPTAELTEQPKTRFKPKRKKSRYAKGS